MLIAWLNHRLSRLVFLLPITGCIDDSFNVIPPLQADLSSRESGTLVCVCVCVNQALPADECMHRIVGLPTSLVHRPSYFVWFQPGYQQDQSRQLLQVCQLKQQPQTVWWVDCCAQNVGI